MLKYGSASPHTFKDFALWSQHFPHSVHITFQVLASRDDDGFPEPMMIPLKMVRDLLFLIAVVVEYAKGPVLALTLQPTLTIVGMVTKYFVRTKCEEEMDECKTIR